MAGQPPHFKFRPVIQDQHTAARAYFLCVVGMLFTESMIRLVPLLVHVLSRRKQHLPSQNSRRHWPTTVYLHKLLTRPSPAPFLTDHTVASILRWLVFTALNILFGWNRIRYTTDYQLYGWLTLANAGLALLLPTRTNLLSLVARIPSPILLAYHRWAGVATVIHATLHFSLTAQHYVRTHQFETVLENARIRVGIMAWAALGLILLTSVRIVRRRAFEVFYYIHFFFIVFIAGAFYHAANAAEFLIPGLALWVLDRGVRAWYSHFRTIKVTSVTQYTGTGHVTKLRFEGLKSAVRPGQIVWVQIPEVSALNWHPFTIIPSPTNKNESTIAIRSLGGYTRKLEQMALDATTADNNIPSNKTSTNTASNMTQSTLLKIRLDGPYGTGRLQYSHFPVIVLVAGGIGITPAIGIASYIVNQAARATAIANPKSGHHHIHLLWTVKHEQHLAWFEPELTTLCSLIQSRNLPVTIAISIYETGGGSEASESEERNLGGGDGDKYVYRGPGRVHKGGRPNLGEWFQRVRASSGRGIDAAVHLCGPRLLVRAGRMAAAEVSGRGGLFWVEEEEFEF